MKVVFIDSKEEQVKEIEIEDKLEEYYKHIGCELIETVYTTINEKPVVIICDEEAALKDEVCKEGFILPDNGFIIGNAIIVGSKEDYFSDSPVSVEEVQREIGWAEAIKAPSQEEIDAAVENIARLNHLAKIEKDQKIKEAIEEHIEYVENYIKGGSTIE